MFPRYQNVHFVGIGGIGMSGIAELLLNLGYRVSGSDQKRSAITTKLRKKGAKIYYQHKASNVESAHVVVVSSAIGKSNPEIVSAQKKKVPVIPRAEMLSELMRLKYGIAVAGSHGKTTTTSMVGQLLLAGQLDPTMVIGGKVNSLRSNAKLGKGDFLVAEADESDGSFLKLNPTFAIITNIDPEHMEHYKDFESLKETFVNFANKVPFYGSIIACVDHPVVKSLIPSFERQVVTYGIQSPADYTAAKIKSEGLKQRFQVLYQKKSLGFITLPMAGKHNISNALAAIAVARELEVPFRQIAVGMRNFKGIQRRMQVLYDQEMTVVDDYGHHPIEIQATLQALRNAFPKRRILALFQPHRYTRTRDLFDGFSQSFHLADRLFLTSIYAASEAPIVGVSARALGEAISRPTVHYISELKEMKKAVIDEAQKGDIIVTLGAGNITHLGHEIAKEFKLRLKKQI